MTMNSSGPISLAGTTAGQSIQIENGGDGTTQISLNDTAVRSLAGVPSGAITIPTDFYGKSNVFNAIICTDQTNLNLRTWALLNGWNGTVPATITVGTGVWIYSTSTGNAGLVVDGSWPNGVTVINNGYIAGQGGKGGIGAATAPTSAGPAISLGVNCSITNNSYIGGGGGGGGNAAITGSVNVYAGAGGGAGGGMGGGQRPANPNGGAGGAPGSAGSNGTVVTGTAGVYTLYGGSGGGGGRIFPGVGGAQVNPYSPFLGNGGGAGGGGGGYGEYRTSFSAGIYGSAGGSAGNAGSTATGTTRSTGGGGGWGASGGSGGSSGGSVAGGAGGKAIALNGFTATRTGAGTTYGAVS